MTNNLPEEGYVRSYGAALLLAIPGFTFLTLYLWLAVTVVAGIVLGITGSLLLGGVSAALLAVPALILNWRIVRTCIDAERRTL